MNEFIEELSTFGKELDRINRNQRECSMLYRKLNAKKAEYLEKKSEICRIAYLEHDMRISEIAKMMHESESSLYRFLKRREWYKEVEGRKPKTAKPKKQYLPINKK